MEYDLTNKSDVLWLWQQDETSWVHYDEITSDILERSFSENIKTVNLDHSIIDLSFMCQKKDNYVKPIKRVSKSQQKDLSLMSASSLQCMKLVSGVPHGFSNRRSEWINSINGDLVKDVPENLLRIVQVPVNRGLYVVFSNDEISRLIISVEGEGLPDSSYIKRSFSKLKYLYGIVNDDYLHVIQKMGNIFKDDGDALFRLRETDTDSLKEALNSLYQKLKKIPDDVLEYHKIELEKTVSELDGQLFSLVSNANGQKNDLISQYDNTLNKARVECEEAHLKCCRSLANISLENKDRDLGFSFLKKDINSLKKYIRHNQTMQTLFKSEEKRNFYQMKIDEAQEELINLEQFVTVDLDANDQQKLQEIQDKYDSVKKNYDTTQKMISTQLETYHCHHEELITRCQILYNLGSFVVTIGSSLCLIKEYKTEICKLIKNKEITLKRVLSMLRPLVEAYLEVEVHTNLSVHRIHDPTVEKYFNIIYQNIHNSPKTTAFNILL